MLIDKQWYNENQGRQFVRNASDLGDLRSYFEGKLGCIYFSSVHTQPSTKGYISVRYDECCYSPHDCHSLNIADITFLEETTNIIEPDESIYNDLI